MTQEEKAKRYDEAIERANSLLSPNQLGNAWIYKLLPELEESEDDRIRKEIITYLSTVEDKELIPYKSWIVWLEKQGEHTLDDLPKGEDYGIDGLYAAIDILQKTLGKVDGYQTDDGILEHKCAINAVKELSKQKPADTEKGAKWNDGEIPNSAWSEEDEKMMMFCCDYLDDNQKSWLLSLKERYTWKPSEEQIKAIKEAACYSSVFSEKTIDNLISLSKQLKAL